MFNRKSRISGFTLVELLVVIGIIALLISILLPALNQVREQGRKIKCASNMKQLITAINMYCNDNKGFYPGRSGYGSDGMQPGTAADPERNYGWIAWRRTKDQFTLASNSANGAATEYNQNITHSALTKYLGFNLKKHATPEEAHEVAPTLEALYRCPSDELLKRPLFLADRGPYRYSYSMNILFHNKWYDETKKNDSAFSYGLRDYVLSDGITKVVPPIYRKITKVKNPSKKLLLYDESENSVNNGECNPVHNPTGNVDVVNTDYTAIAERHDLRNKKNAEKNVRGNVAFADGHVDFIGRNEAFSREYFDPDF